MNGSHRAAGVLAVVLVLVGAACGDDSAEPQASTVPSTTVAAPVTSSTVATVTTTSGSETTTTVAAPVTTSSTTTSSSTTSSTTATTAPATTTTTLRGEPIDLFAQEGDVLAVVGVAHDDVLNLRDGPGTDRDVIARLDPLEDQAIATGRARLLPSSIWYEVTVDGVTGWASATFLGFIGGTRDVTAEVVAVLGSGPIAETMLDLGRIVAETFASAEPRSDITVTIAPSGGDEGEVTYDVVGLGDDAMLGLRVHVRATVDGGGEAFVLSSVETTALCGRGVSEGLCV